MAESSLRSHPGLVREENQDRVDCFGVPLGELFFVFDGVGGHTGGSRAASLGRDEYRRFLAKVRAGSDPADSLQQATMWVNARLADARLAGPAGMQEMASTVALVLLAEHKAYVGHIGDSRVYRARRGVCEILTEDHSVVQRMINQGILSSEQARSHPNASILTRSLGQPKGQMDVSAHGIETDDLLLICSDGLWGYTSPEQLEEILSRGGSTASIADRLLELALAGGGGDNISIALVKIGEAPAKGGGFLKRFGRGRLYTLLAVTALLAGAAVCVAVWGPW
ncbi:serine/threonine protein phosphatase PrpC [Granulicella aggregans]|uniref:Serine/threonine protein phosphatase PrpC n=1 Tax=Granulicella aggregans TaxID=474949 RepID=A0A7W7ZBL8_9BACT|nr:serine/threonine protein phosphatase PrpC [Granulicella aggregans]